MRIYLCKIKTRLEDGFLFYEPDLPADVVSSGVTINQWMSQNGDQTPKYNWCLVSIDGVSDYSVIDAITDNYYIDALPLESILSNGQKNSIQNKLDTFGITVDVGAAVTVGDIVSMIKSVMV